MRESVRARLSSGKETAKPRPLLVRLAAGLSEQKLCSGVWRIWQQSVRKDDIYIAVRTIAAQVKCSLHANRYCYMGFTKLEFNRMTGEQRGGRSREWFSWERLQTPENGYLVAAEIMLPPSPLYNLEKAIAEPTWLFQPPPAGKGVLVSLLFSRIPKGNFFISPEAIELGQSQLGNGEYAVVLAGIVDFDYELFKTRNQPLLQASLQNMRLISPEPDFLNRPLRTFLVCDKISSDDPIRIVDAAVTVSRS